MAMRKAVQRTLIYVGIKGSVVALDRESGEIAWSTELPRGSSFVPVSVDGTRIFAASGGEVSCLDAATGKILWHNRLKGYGVGYAMLSGASAGAAAAAAEQLQAAATATQVHAG